MTDIHSVKEHIDAIVKNTFETIKSVYMTQKENTEIGINNNPSRIVFPLKRESNNEKGEIRISEQELRFVFVEEFNKYCNKKKWDAYYSVETPTSNRYDFSDKGKPSKVEPPKGQSAMVDFSIFLKEQEKLTRFALIEFKALNPDKQSYMKDYVKLLNESQELVYFIMIVKSANERTNKSIAEKIKASYDNAGLETRRIVEFRCLDLGTGNVISEDDLRITPQ